MPLGGGNSMIYCWATNHLKGWKSWAIWGHRVCNNMYGTKVVLQQISWKMCKINARRKTSDCSILFDVWCPWFGLTTVGCWDSRRKEHNLGTKQGEPLQRSLECTAVITSHPPPPLCMWRYRCCFILFSTVTCVTDVNQYHMNSISFIKSHDVLIAYYTHRIPHKVALLCLICIICSLPQDGGNAREHLDQFQQSIIPPFGDSWPE